MLKIKIYGVYLLSWLVVYNTSPPTFGYEILEKKSHIIHINILEFVAAKFNICLIFLSCLYWLNIRIYIVYIMFQNKIYTAFWTKTCSHKNVTNFGKNNFTIEQIINKPSHYFSLVVCPVGWGCRIHQLLLCRGGWDPHLQWVSWIWH